MLHAIDRIKCGLDDGKHVTALFLDISKAFDCVDHTLLLDKLEKAGIRGKAHELIVDYLFGRELRVRSDGVLSVESFMTTGIPQGSSLSTLLYLVYTNDLYDLALQGYFQSFADDTMAVYAADTPTQLQEMIQQDTDLLADWFYSNNLSISTGKTRLMNFSLRTRPFQPQVVYNNTLLVSTSVYKYLGFHIDDRLTFSEHLKHIKSKIVPFTAMLKRVRFMIPTTSMLSVYYAYIHSHLLHLISVWGFASNYMIDQLQVIQNRAIRFIFWRDYIQLRLSTEAIYRKYRIMNIQQLLKYDAIFTIFKRLNVDLQTFEGVHTYNTRGRSDFILPLLRTTTAQESLFSMGLAWTNQLPQSVKHHIQMVPFRKSLKLEGTLVCILAQGANSLLSGFEEFLILV